MFSVVIVVSMCVLFVFFLLKCNVTALFLIQEVLATRMLQPKSYTNN